MLTTKINRRIQLRKNMILRKIIFLLICFIALRIIVVNINEVSANFHKLQQALMLTSDNAKFLNDQGGKFFDAGQYTEAKPFFLKSLGILKKELGENHFYVGMVSSNLAVIYDNEAKYNQAEFLYWQSLFILESALGKNHPYIADILNNLAILYDKMGKHDKVESLYKRSLAIKEMYHYDVTSTLSNLANFYYAQGKYELLEPLLYNIISVKKSLRKNDMVFASSLQNLAHLYNIQGKNKLAEKLYLQSLAISQSLLGKTHPNVIRFSNNLARFYHQENKYTQAESLYKNDLATVEKNLGKNNPDFAAILQNIAELYAKQGSYNLAESLTLQSLLIRKRVFGQNHPAIADNLIYLAKIYHIQNKYDQAKHLYLDSLIIREKNLEKNHYSIATTLDNLAILYNGKNEYEQAKPLLQKSLRIMNSYLNRWLQSASEKTRQSYLLKENTSRNYYLSFYSFRNIPDEAFYFSLTRKGLLLKIASEMKILSKNIADSETQKLAESFKEKKQQLANLMMSGKINSNYMATLEEEINILEVQLSQKISLLKQNRTEVVPEQVIHTLNSNQVLIDFLVYDEIDLKEMKYKTQQLIALVVDKKGIKLVKLGAMQPITQAIQAYHQVIEPKGETVRERMDSLKDATRKQILTANAKALYRKIWQPLLGYLGDKKEIYVIPDGALNVFPMKAMQDESGHYLAESYSLKLLSSARDIVLPPGNNGSRQASAIFAGVYYDEKQVAEAKTIEQAEQIVLDKQQAETAQAKGETVAKKRGDLKFPYLIKSFGEGLAIQAQMKTTQQPVNFFSGFAASEAAIKQVKSPRFLVLSTHGFFLEDQPAPRLEQAELLSVRGLLDNPFNVSAKLQDNPLTRSGLAFARANDSAGITDSNNDGVLTALEVLGLDLENTDLVTLSACQTALGNIQVGEGVYSLNRAFQEAGAKAVLSTLWKVDDEKTQAFMQRFYAEVILNHVPVQQALQQTQINFITDAERPKIHQDPYFWAAFSMVGL